MAYIGPGVYIVHFNHFFPTPPPRNHFFPPQPKTAGGGVQGWQSPPWEVFEVFNLKRWVFTPFERAFPLFPFPFFLSPFSSLPHFSFFFPRHHSPPPGAIVFCTIYTPGSKLKALMAISVIIGGIEAPKICNRRIYQNRREAHSLRRSLPIVFC